MSADDIRRDDVEQYISATVLITDSAVALHCCKAHSQINGKMENSTPVIS